jgi:low temperature requirement protein LtrA
VTDPSAATRLLRPLSPRDPTEAHRVASPLELLTDLCVVVAVSEAAANLHHGLVTEHPGHYVLGYAMAFFAIWCTWLNFTWFGSAYDNDDVAYRLLTILQIIGVLVLAASIDGFFEGHFGLAILGYVIMRVALIAQWLRAARADPARRVTCLRYAAGTGIVQVGWVAFFPLSQIEAARVPGFLVLAVAELAVPVVAERAGITPWHPHHIAERYALFFIIVLGETILASTVAVKEAFGTEGHNRAPVFMLMVSGVLIVFSLWWTYFAHEASDVLARAQGASNLEPYVWGFGHYFIFASAAAVGAGIAARIEYWIHPDEVSGLITAAGITAPAAVLVAAMWVVHLRQHDESRLRGVLMGVASVAVLASTLTPLPELAAGLLLAALVTAMVWLNTRGQPGGRVRSGSPAL